MITLYLPRPLSTNSLYGQRAGRQRYKTKAYKKWSEKALAMLAGQEWEPINQPYWMDMVMRRYGNSGDATNYIKGAEDQIVAAGVVRDDKDCLFAAVGWGEPGPGRACRVRIHTQMPDWMKAL